MTRKQWNKRFRKALRSLPASERNAAAEYYDELYGDKRDAGMSEEAITAEFGDPEDAARRIADEAGVAVKERRAATAADTASRTAIVVILGLFVGIPLLAVLLSVAVVFLSVAISGVAVSLAGVAQFVWAIVMLIGEGATGAHVAHLGIGIAATGAGAVMLPVFAYLTWLCVRLLGMTFAWVRNFIKGKRSARHG